MFKEQIKQHSLTIVEFEKEVSRLREKESLYLSQIESLRKKKETVQTQFVPTVQAFKMVDNTMEVESLGRTIDLLR